MVYTIEKKDTLCLQVKFNNKCVVCMVHDDL